MSGTISLTSGQEERAEELLEMLYTDITPDEVVDEWRAAPSRVGMEGEVLGEHCVLVADIVGTEGHNVERLDAGRMRRVVEMLVQGEFELEHHFPPVLCKVNGEYFVDADGNHRVLAHKYIGIDEIYAEVVEYTVE